MLNRLEKISSIELLRFISAYVILIWHYQHFAINSNEIFEVSEQPFYKLLKYFYLYGDWGVLIFWCISGYIFFYNYYKKISENKITFRTFLINRISRLYPLHFITLLLVLIFQIIILKIDKSYYIYKYNDIIHFIYNLFFISGWGFEKGYSFNGPIWSVSIEIIIYLFFYCLSKLFNIFLIFINATLIFFLFIFLNKTIANCFVLFFFGGFLFALQEIFRNKINYIFSTFFSFILLIFISILLKSEFTIYNFNNFGQINNISYTIIKDIWCISLVAFFISVNNFISKLYVKKIFNYLGNLTYGIYLTHIPVTLIIYIYFLFTNLKINYKNYNIFFIYLTLVTIISILSYKLIENPSKNYLRKFLK